MSGMHKHSLLAKYKLPVQFGHLIHASMIYFKATLPIGLWAKFTVRYEFMSTQSSFSYEFVEATTLCLISFMEVCVY